MAQHTKTIEVYTCDSCSAEVKPEDMLYGVVIDFGDSRHGIDLCPSCEVSFREMVALGTRLDKPNTCWCGRAFASEQGLAVHKGRMGHWGLP
jgi:hypothetical protein